MAQHQNAIGDNATSNPAWTYENYMVPALFGPWADQLVSAADPKLRERVLDVGCGTGIVARKIAEKQRSVARVAGIDLSPDMLTVAREAADRNGLPIEWHQGRAEQLPFPDESFDVVTCQFALMFMADRYAALAEMRRVLVDGGRLVLSVWQSMDRHPFYQSLHEVIHRRFGMSGVQDIFALGDAEALRAELESTGFKDIGFTPVSLVARFPQPEAFLAGEIDLDTAAIPSMQQLDLQERRRIVETIQGEMEQPLHRVVQDGYVVLPFHAYLVRAVT